MLVLVMLGAVMPDAQARRQDKDAAPAEKDELVKEFYRFYKPRRDIEEKIAAIRVLENSDPMQATQALVKAFDDPDEAVRNAAVETIGTFRDPACVAFLIENYIVNRKERKLNRILCAVKALGLIGDESAVDSMLLLWRRMKHKDFKKAIGMSLGHLKTERSLPIMTELLKEDDPLLRIIAVDAIAGINNPEALLGDPEEETKEPRETCKQALGRLLVNDSQWQVRAAVINAMRKMRFKEAIQPLIDALRREEGRLRGDAYEALKELTFSQWGDDPDEWQRYWDRVKDKFEMVDLEVVLKAREKRKEQGSRYSEATPRFAGIPTKSRKIVFVVDISRSMETPVTDTARYREMGRDYKTFARLEIVQDELIRTIKNFDATVEFNILAFATNMRWWKKSLVKCNILNKNSAISFIENLQPIGGGANQFKARAGLKTGDSLEAGKTNTYGAFMTALGYNEDGTDIDERKSLNYEVDTIYFLSDGEPTVGKEVDLQKIVTQVTQANENRKVVLNTIAIGDFRKSFLERLAKKNGGIYVDLGK